MAWRPTITEEGGGGGEEEEETQCLTFAADLNAELVW